jgi:serine/threonine-protein kinase RsbW
VSGAYPVLHEGSFGSTGSVGLAGSTRPRSTRGPWALVFRGTAASVPLARRFVGEVLAGCPAREVLMTCVSELCANAVTHTLSGSGGVFVVSVAYPRDGVARVAVTDEGGPSVPSARPVDLAAEGGRGLALVAACTSRWGWAEAYPGRTVWAEACWPVGVPTPGRDRPRPHRSAVSPVPPAPSIPPAPSGASAPLGASGASASHGATAPPAPGDWTPSSAA